MKKINSNGYAHKIIGLAGLFIAVIPFFCHVLYSVFSAGLLKVFMYISLTIGFLVLVFLIGLLSIEFYQDKRIDRQYINIKKKKLPLDNEFYECQSCGNRRVNERDNSCCVCGIRFTIKRSCD